MATSIMMKIAVVGATGPTGIHLVTELRKTVPSCA
jgi:NADH dehydrogenase FAD-containing subunit